MRKSSNQRPRKEARPHQQKVSKKIETFAEKIAMERLRLEHEREMKKISIEQAKLILEQKKLEIAKETNEQVLNTFGSTVTDVNSKILKGFLFILSIPTFAFFLSVIL